MYCTQRCRTAAAFVTLTCTRCAVAYQRRRCEVEKAKRHGFVRTFCSKRCQAGAEAAAFAGVRSCRTCGTSLPSKTVHAAKYCSPGCWQRVIKPMERTSCEHCGGMFEMLRYELAKKRRRGYRVYCSPGCVADGLASRGATCEQCGAGMPRAKGRRFCSTECRHSAPRSGRAGRLGMRRLPERTCPMCSRPFRPKSSQTAYCGRACANAAHSLRMIGRGNSRYLDGSSYADWFRKMRPVIFERDGHRCVACGEVPEPTRFVRKGQASERSRLLVHHVDHDPRDNRPENLVSVCQPCHGKHHKSTPTPFPWFAEYAGTASRSMTSRLRATATFLQDRYSSTTA